MGSKYYYNTFSFADAETKYTNRIMIKKNPTYLFSRQINGWKKISRILCKTPRIALLLDYDGTLTPIRHKPSAATLTPESERLLQRLSNLHDIDLSIVTGRSMEDIKRLVPVEKITIVANHGFHILQNGKEWIHPEAVSLIRTLKSLAFILDSTLNDFPKAYVENKQFTLSIHYRNILMKDIPSFISIVTKTIRSFDPTLIITRGKKVLEVRPNTNWGKGTAVKQILSQKRGTFLSVFIGDDTTDEDVFRILHSKGINIRVGKEKATYAKYYVKNVREVMQLLDSILSFRTNRLSCRNI
jgi:trehalose-phosphatase